MQLISCLTAGIKGGGEREAEKASELAEKGGVPERAVQATQGQQAQTAGGSKTDTDFIEPCRSQEPSSTADKNLAWKPELQRPTAAAAAEG